LLLGHRKRFPAVIAEAREDIEELKEKRKRDKEKRKRQNELTDIAAEKELVIARETGIGEKEDPGKALASKDDFPDFILPDSKNTSFFASHRKKHTRFGSASERLALQTKDTLMLKYKLNGYFDVDSLTKISMQALTAGILSSCW
jgi:hypothetical protein